MFGFVTFLRSLVRFVAYYIGFRVARIFARYVPLPRRFHSRAFWMPIPRDFDSRLIAVHRALYFLFGGIFEQPVLADREEWLRKHWRYFRKAMWAVMTPGPKYVEISSYCCDTGRYGYVNKYRNGFHALKAIDPYELNYMSDGPTYGWILQGEALRDYLRDREEEKEFDMTWD